MWLIICEPGDWSALWAYRGLHGRGLAPLELVSPEVLAGSRRWEHRIASKETVFAVTLAAGRRLDGMAIRGVLNRMQTIPLALWRRASPEDQRYVQQELFAFYLSWLHGLPCPVINRPTPMGLAGQWRPESEWVCLAGQAGVPTPVFRQTSGERIGEAAGQRRLSPPNACRQTVVVAGGRAAGAAVPAEIADACVRLAVLAGTALLGVDFIAGSEGTWTFAGATPMPDLRAGGEAGLDALAAALRGEGDA